jgi:hypothetical protein
MRDVILSGKSESHFSKGKTQNDALEPLKETDLIEKQESLSILCHCHRAR